MQGPPGSRSLLSPLRRRSCSEPSSRSRLPKEGPRISPAHIKGRASEPAAATPSTEALPAQATRRAPRALPILQRRDPHGRPRARTRRAPAPAPVALVGVGMVPRAWGTSPPRAPLPSPLVAFGVFELLAPLLTSRIRGSRGSVPSRQPGQLGAGLGAAFVGLGEERVGAGEVAQVEHGAVAAGRPGPRWAGARAAGRESGRPSSRLPALGSGTRLGGPRRPGSPAPASGGGSWLLQSATGLSQPTVPPLI